MKMKVETRWHWAWQADAEAEWLRSMGREGWEFVAWRPMQHYFFRQAEPRDCEYLVERRWALFPKHQSVEEAYLDGRAREHWQLVQPTMFGWYVFRREASDD